MTPPPQRVRVARLQDLQLDGVVAIDAACKADLHRHGVPASEQPARGVGGVAKLTKLHNVLVADADGVVAGYAAWRDESPGVAYLEELAVKPELAAHGIGARLLDAVKEEARALSLPILLARVWTKDASGRALLEQAGMAPLAGGAVKSDRAALWQEEQGSALAKEGQVVLVQSLL